MQTDPATPASRSQPGEIKAAIFGHAEFTAFNQRVTELFEDMAKAANTPLLNGIKQGDHPKVLIETLSESLLETFRNEGIASLIDPYDVYQHLMDYWAETMQDDACWSQRRLESDIRTPAQHRPDSARR